MVEQAGALPGDAETSLADSRAQFVASLGRRLEALQQALSALEQAPRSATHRDHLRRRVHAFGAAAGVLGFDRVFEAFREAEGLLAKAGPTGSVSPSDLQRIARTLDLVPSLVLGANVSVGRSAAPPPGERRPGGFPTSVIVFGAGPLGEALAAGAPSGEATIECELTDDAERAEDIVRMMAPDVAVIDADRKGARELIETLTYDPLLDPVRIVAVGSFDRPEAAASLVALGVARVLPKPVSPDILRRTVLEVSRERVARATRVEPLGHITVEALGERVAQEVRRGLVDAVRAQSRGAEVAFGDGTDVLAAVWASVARIRELVTLRSGGAVRFDATGPEGAVPLAPWMSDERSRGADSGERREGSEVSLQGRTIVVADDDPAIAWFLSGLMRGAGAEVFEALDGGSALELTRQRWPDVVISDILMPGLDGFSLCREVKRDIALSDTPVILLSWKEDLLQRVHELGAQADGYLRKEATASVVVQRVREVLLPRARIEARIAAGGEARGRLDGMTPRLVLQLVCRRGHDATVSVRDAAFLYEVEVRGGRLKSATRTTPEGRSERGDGVLAALLGVRAGRFAVRASDSPPPADWDLTLSEAVRAPVERARAALRALSSPATIARVELDGAAIGPYVAATPEPAASVVRRLLEGARPSDIVAGGLANTLVESVLFDMVLHGAVRGVVGEGGTDLLAAELAVRGPMYRTPQPPEIVPARDRALRQAKAPAAAKSAGTAPAVVAPSSGVAAKPPGADATPGSPPVAGADASAPPPAAAGRSAAMSTQVSAGAPGPAPVEEPPAVVFREARIPTPLPESRSFTGSSLAAALTAVSGGTPPAPAPEVRPDDDVEGPVGGSFDASSGLQAAASPSPGPASVEAEPPALPPVAAVLETLGQTTAAVPFFEISPEPPGAGAAGAAPKGEGSDAAFLFGDSMFPSAPPPREISIESPPSRSQSMKALAPPTSMPAEPSPFEAALRAIPAEVAARSSSGLRPAVKVDLPSGPAASGGTPVQDLPETVPQRPRLPRVSPPPPRPRPEEGGGVELGDAVLASLEEPFGAAGRAAAAPAAPKASAGPLAPLPRPVAVGDGATGGGTPAARARLEPPQVVTQVSARDGEPPPPLQRIPPPPVETAREGAAARVTPPSPAPVESASANVSGAPAGVSVVSARPAEVSAKATLATPAPGAGSSAAPPVVAREPASAPVPPASPKSEGAKRGPAPAARKASSPDPKAKGPLPQSGSPLMIAVVTLVAATTSFALISAIQKARRERDEAEVTPVATIVVESPPAVTAPPVAASVPAEPALSLTLEDLELPPGLAVPAGSGMLELELPGATSITVDGIVVGGGAPKQLPLSAGPHEVKAVTGAAEFTVPVVVRAGRRARIAPASGQ